MITCGGQQDKKTLRRINKLIEDAKRHPTDWANRNR
jgi:Txe/YoeB family toxin of Txe-Axe toxin-antitoxin module